MLGSSRGGSTYIGWSQNPIIEILLVPGYTEMQICIVRSSDAVNWSHSQRKFQKLSQALPFLDRNTRSPKTVLWLHTNPQLTMGHISELERISYIWREGVFQILPEYAHTNDADTIFADARYVLTNRDIMPCSQFWISGFDFRLRDYYHLLFQIPVLVIRRNMVTISSGFLVEFIRQFFMCKTETVIFLTLNAQEAENVLTAAFSEFRNATETHSHVFVIEMANNKQFNAKDFRKENCTTNEVMQVKPVTEAETHARYGVHLQGYPTYMIERSEIK